MEEKLDLGSVLGRAFGAMTAAFLPFVVMAVILLGPIVFGFIEWVKQVETIKELERAAMVMTIVSVLMSIVLQGAIVHAMFQHLRGRSMGIGESIGRGFQTLFMVLIVSIIAGVLTGLATLALIIPGLIVACVLYLVVPVAVIERAGLGSLGRSSYLTRGHRWSIFALVLIVGVIDVITDRIIDRLAEDGSLSLELMVGIPFGIAALFSLFSAACGTAVYVDLRRIKENMDIEEIATLFE